MYIHMPLQFNFICKSKFAHSPWKLCQWIIQIWQFCIVFSSRSFSWWLTIVVSDIAVWSLKFLLSNSFPLNLIFFLLSLTEELGAAFGVIVYHQRPEARGTPNRSPITGLKWMVFPQYNWDCLSCLCCSLPNTCLT